MRTSLTAPASYPAPASLRSPAVSVPPSPTSSTAPTAPEPYTPPRCAVPPFAPIRAGSGWYGGRRLHRPARRKRRTAALGLAMTAAALAATAAHGAAPRQVAAAPRGPSVVKAVHGRTADVVRAPVRIADASVVGLLHPGDRVDVLAASRVVAYGVTVVAIPRPATHDSAPPQPPANSGLPGGDMGGALVVLAVPRPAAAALSGAASTSPLAVALC